MFFAGHGGGSCAAGGGHVADWLNFTLPHTGGEGWTTVQGWIGPTGDGAFNQKVLSHIETLKKSPSFQKMWGVILKTGHRVTILPAEPGGSNYTTDQFQNDSFLLDDGITPGRGCDVIVRYNPDSEGMALQKGNQPWRRAGAPYISLGHELVHCWMSTTGVAPRSIGQRESRATGLPPFADVEFSENRFRRELGLPLRDVY
jgi:hypothetical protein